MRYESFSISNYKGIRNLEFDLKGKQGSNIYTLVGLNESGKTTILEALAYWYENFQMKDDQLHRTNIQDPRELIPRSEQFNFKNRISITAEIVLDPKDWLSLGRLLRENDCALVRTASSNKVKFTISWKFRESELIDSADRILDSTIFYRKGRSKKLIEISPEDPIVWSAFAKWIKSESPQLIYYPNFLFDFPDKIFIDKKDEDSKIQRFYYKFIEDILQKVDSDMSIATSILQRTQKTDTPTRRALQGTIARINRVMNDLMQDLNVFHFGIESKEIVLTIPTIDISNMRFYVQFNLKENDDTYDIRERSLGFRWFFTFVLLTQFRINRRNDKPPVFLLDEPASNLHQTSQRRLLKAIENLTKTVGSGVIYTTHSHHLINPNWLESVYIVKNEAYSLNDETYHSRNTNIKMYKYRDFVEENPNDIDYFQPVLDVLEYQPSSLEKLSNALIMEGKNDFYTLSLILKNDKLEYSIIPGTSATKLGTLISLYYGWGKKFVVILDSDEAGISQKKRYKDAFGPMIDQHIFTLFDVNEAWSNTSMEKLFSNDEKISIQKIKYPDDTRFNKKHFNAVIQEALVQNQDLPITAETKEKFQEIASFVNQRLKSQQ